MGKKKKTKKRIERICRNCKLFDPAKSECAVVVLHEGQRLHLPVLAKDPCFFEGEYFDATSKAKEDFAGEIKEVKFWVENKQGQKTDGNGIVKMEYPEGFLGTGADEMLGLDDNDPDVYEYLKMLQERKAMGF
jgi:sugar phosphate isomerase/epimerase